MAEMPSNPLPLQLPRPSDTLRGFPNLPQQVPTVPGSMGPSSMELRREQARINPSPPTIQLYQISGEYDPQRGSEGTGTDPRESVRFLRQQIEDLLDTGMYSDENDPVILALREELSNVEALVANIRR